MSRLIDVENLTLQFDTDEGRITAVDDVSFSLEAGEVMGLVGESGSGKSVTAKSLMKLNPRNAVYGDDTKITLHLEDGPVDVMSLRNDSEMKVVRGGAWRDDLAASTFRGATREHLNVGSQDTFTGFRCAMSSPSPPP